MVDVVKDLFNKSTFGLFSSPEPEGPSEAEVASQAKQRRDEEEEQALLLSRGPSRVTGRGRKIGRQLLSFVGPSGTKTGGDRTGARTGGRTGGAFRGPSSRGTNRIR